MIRIKLFLFIWIYFVCAIPKAEREPSQIHLSVTGDDTQMNINWVTVDKTTGSSVQYGTVSGLYTNWVNGTSHTYTEGGFDGLIHNTLLTNLKIGTKYFYKCGDQQTWSQEYFFITGNSSSEEFKFGLVGDMGVTFSQWTMDWMIKDVQNNLYDMVVHIGDISYCDDRPAPNSYIFDEFMNRIQPITAHVPYMVCPGNHEVQFHFAAYINRFRMPTTESNSNSTFWYSYDYKMVHFVSISTEHSFAPGSEQYNWIVSDLKKAQANRQKTPWIIVFGHRPFYCSNIIDGYITGRCTTEATKYKSWIEDIFHQYKVDLYISGHNHAYERSYPVYKEEVTNGERYDNPKATVYIVNGAAGDKEFIDPTFLFPAPSWRGACRPGEFGYSRFQVTRNSLTHQFINDYFGDVSDEFTIKKN